MTTTAGATTAAGKRQRRMGPAPFASFEDLSDDVKKQLDSPPADKSCEGIVRLPGIREDASTPGSVVSVVMNPTVSTSQGSTNLQTPSTPRIDISRASSSSHHDSRDSSPENIFAEGGGEDVAGKKSGLGFREEGALDLRSSTEELDFMDPAVAQAEKEKQQQQTSRRSPLLFKPEDRYVGTVYRKDSQCSDVVLLTISGRTSRLSSVGSQGSNTSRLSATSNYSRSPSPHKMLLETSFCGPKPIETSAGVMILDQPASATLEHALLSRKNDPMEAVIAEGIAILGQDKVIRTTIAASVKTSSVTATQKEHNVCNKQETPVPIVDKTRDGQPKSTQYVQSNNKNGSVKDISRRRELDGGGKKAAGAGHSNYIRIKLKPDHMYDNDADDNQSEIQKPITLNLNDTVKKSAQHFSQLVQNEDANKITRHPDQAGGRRESRPANKLATDTAVDPSSCSASPKPVRHHVLRDLGSRTPSPSPVNVSRKSSFCSLFRSRETIASPESPTGQKRKGLSTLVKDASEIVKDRSRSRSKSRDRDRISQSTTPTGKQKSMFTIFKPKRNGSKSKSASPVEPECLPNLDGITKVEFTFKDNDRGCDLRQRSKEHLRYYDTPLEGDSIRIPLHTPTQEEEKRLEVHPCRTPNDATVAPPRITVSDDHDTRREKRDKNKVYRIPLPDGNFRIPLHSPSEEQNWGEDVCKVLEKQQNAVPPPVIDLKPSRPTSQETPNCAVEPTFQSSEPEYETDVNETVIKSTKEHILFSTKIGSREQIFSTQFSLTKTDSQSSQFSCDRAQESIPELKDDNVPATEINMVAETTKAEEKTEPDVSETEYIVVTPKQSRIEEDVQSDIILINKDNKIIPRQSTDEMDHNSSESERESDADYVRRRKIQSTGEQGSVDHESKGLVLQQEESFDDELPYVPTTLPQERSVAVPMLPIKQRVNFEIKTCPVERPRSTTPINPSCLEEYCLESPPPSKEKLKISLPREDSSDRPLKSKSPRRLNNSTSSKTWFEFAEQGIAKRKNSVGQDEVEVAPPLPPRKSQWINFEEIPEKRKPPTRIQTIPSRGAIDVPEPAKQHAEVIYNYVNPEDCKCECHDATAKSTDTHGEEVLTEPEEDLQPLLEVDQQSKDSIKKFNKTATDRRSIVSDSSLDYSNSAGHTGSSLQLGKPFDMDLDMGASSNRSSIISQDDDTSTLYP